MAQFPEGVDLSSHDAIVDFEAAKQAGISFAIVKATQGTGYTNPYYAQQVQGAKAAGLIVGHYHFYDPAVGNPVAQANHYCDTVGTLGAGDLPPFVDLEAPNDAGENTPIDPPNFLQQYGVYIDQVQHRLGQIVTIYTYPSYWRDSLGNPTHWSQTNPLWLASYKVATPPPKLVGGWKSCLFHQYDDHGRVPGIKGGTGDVDRDRFVGTMEELRNMAKLNTPVPSNDCDYYEPTKQYLCHGFREFYNRSGGLAVFGYPITGEVAEKLSDGNTYTVQYFEHGQRMEWHSDHVELGLTGNELLALKGGKP